MEPDREKNNGKNPHEGHRERVRRRFVAGGLDGFTEHEALELLLCYAIPRRDVNGLAHRLIERFGGLAGVLDAPFDALTETEGVGERAAVLIKLVPQLSRKYMLSHLGDGKNAVLDNVEKAGQFFVPFFHARTDEVVYLACLDPRCRLISCRVLAEGNEAFAAITIKQVLETAVRERAFSIILAHNHPNGVVVPSRDDIQSTLRIVRALEAAEIHFVDHIIVAGSDFASMSECGYLN